MPTLAQITMTDDLRAKIAADPFHPLRYTNADEPNRIYGQWFDADGCGPSSVVVRISPLPPMPGRTYKADDHCMGICFEKNTADPFNFGAAPFDAGPLLSRRDVERLHAKLGEWLAATAGE